MSQERMAVEKQEKIKPLFPSTIWGWFVLLVATFICNQVMEDVYKRQSQNGRPIPGQPSLLVETGASQ